MEVDDNDDSSLIEWKLMPRRIETISIRPPFASICIHLLLLFMLAYLQKSGSARAAYSLALKNGADKVDWCRLLSHRWFQDVLAMMDAESYVHGAFLHPMHPHQIAPKPGSGWSFCTLKFPCPEIGWWALSHSYESTYLPQVWVYYHPNTAAPQFACIAALVRVSFGFFTRLQLKICRGRL